MRTIRRGGDGYSWRSRNEKYLWCRMDFLSGHEFAQEYLIQKIPLWKKLSEFGFPAPDLVGFRRKIYFVRQPWVTESQTSLSLSDLCLAIAKLQSLAESGLAHGDLSPEHLLKTKDGVTWIDWINVTALGSIGYRGKMEYLSPERQSSGIVTESSEIYALGKILLGWDEMDSRLRLIAEKAASPSLAIRYSRLALLREDLVSLLKR